MSNYIFIGNIPFEIDEGTLSDFIRHTGTKPVSVRVMRDTYSGRSRGFGFAAFENEQEAQIASQALHRQPIMDRLLVVNRSILYPQARI
ncbi:hypothetical protein A2154_02895 [Candidatus Gottesmanbacteria bacterium RBG_16_43_7]|uniref:RRM domain-containing protein n=1 Tax=Candidatus Gottesmanbacteria bacterium RBG_16_43_7 TaxID=1798373 RepID=A0A1F5Z8X8_9BACT|nr:MAG: hypothetical protein A2154_02895 [Candidatus Gottesmanbacteria bacterium RBG_16_43_7]